MNLKELYQEIILDHGKNPRNLRKTDNFNKDAKGYNPLCGDSVHVYLKLDEKKKVEDASFEGSGCAISMASASIMTDLVKGKDTKEVNFRLNRKRRSEGTKVEVQSTPYQRESQQEPNKSKENLQTAKENLQKAKDSKIVQ